MIKSKLGTKPYITCELVGGLGNQLFQVATTLAYGFEYDFKPVFIKIDSSPSVFENRSVYWDSFFSKLNFINNYVIKEFLTYSESKFSYHSLPKFTQSTLLKGYFQSSRYFNDYKKEIFNLVSLPEHIKNKIDQKYSDYLAIEDKTAIHVRRGDYLKLKKIHTVLSETNYYLDALTLIPKSSMLVVFSDDIEWCRANFKKMTTPRPYGGFNFSVEKYHENRRLMFIQDIDYVELYLMSKCNNHIIANSSFSWWGSYLSSSNGIVVAPKNWFGRKSDVSSLEDLYLKYWKVI